MTLFHGCTGIHYIQCGDPYRLSLLLFHNHSVLFGGVLNSMNSGTNHRSSVVQLLHLLKCHLGFQGCR